ncbi:ABC transporter ATP-binding protein [Actinomyces mediterranea]|uniref:ABC transporter ATP-binding protein n=1 Tax=Actinomyces mediterranea TaxID=1871028 RepID=UPI000970EC8B|nr:ABC transporter ATP-binding protein [Actinomyces mediterranea]
MDSHAPLNAISCSALVRIQGGFTLGPLDFAVPSGYVTGFVGPNGAGKTTTLKSILGLVKTHAGSICVLGAPVGQRHERIGVVLDSLALPHEWTAKTAARTLSRFYPTWDQRYFDELLERLDVPATVKVHNLSRGQSIKLQLALAFAHRPELLILDEPTSGMDPVARLDILDLFREYMVDERRTLLFSTHITSDLERIADHLHVIAAGRTCYAGPMTALSERLVVVRGPLASLNAKGRGVVHGLSERHGVFEGVIDVANTALFGSDVLVEPVGLDEAIAALTRRRERTPSAASPFVAEQTL